MALPGTPTIIGAVQSAASGTSLTITVGTAIPAGDSVFVNAGHDGAATVTMSVSDSRSNTYTKDAFTGDATGAASGENHGGYRSRLATGLQVSDTIVVTYSTNVSTIGAAGYSITGLPAQPLESFRQDHAIGAESTVNPGSVAVTNSEAILVAGVFHDTTATTSGASGYTLLDEIAIVSTRKLATLYKKVSLGGVYNENVASLSGVSSAKAYLVAYTAQQQVRLPADVPVIYMRRNV